MKSDREDGAVETLRRAVVAEREEYCAEEDRPLGQYARVLVVYASVAGALVGIARRRRRPLPDFGPYDLALLALATNRLSALLSRDAVTSPLRAPFTRYRGVLGPAQLHEEARGTGLRHTVGELVTCPFCVSQWVATALVSGHVFAPRATRLVATTFSALAVSDLVQFGRAALQHAAEG
jgi:hypothetical protein